MAAGDSGRQDAPSGPHQVIEGYGAGRFRINGRAFESSVIVFAEHTLVWPVSEFSGIDAASLQPVIDASAEVDILLLGCGERMALVPPALREALRAHGIVIEAMDTGAAARTFNLLLSEGRLVAAALIAVGEAER